MRTAISIPDALFAAAERMSKRSGIPRSRLYARAIEAYLRAHKVKGITEALDALYRREDSSLDPLPVAMQTASVTWEEW